MQKHVHHGRNETRRGKRKPDSRRSVCVDSSLDPERESTAFMFQRMAMAQARKALMNAVEWIDKKEVSWALVETELAKDLLEVAR